MLNVQSCKYFCKKATKTWSRRVLFTQTERKRSKNYGGVNQGVFEIIKNRKLVLIPICGFIKGFDNLVWSTTHNLQSSPSCLPLP